jgi:hypothetical protein
MYMDLGGELIRKKKSMYLDGQWKAENESHWGHEEMGLNDWLRIRPTGRLGVPNALPLVLKWRQ